MNIFLVWLSGVIVTLVHVERTVLCQRPFRNNCMSNICNCTYVAVGKRYANCFKLGFLLVPKDLGDLHILNISANRFKRLTKSDMELYPSLVELNMHSTEMIDDPIKFEPDFLLPLKKLEILNISGSNLVRPPITLPPTITKLYANAVSRNVSFVDFSALKNLAHLEMNDCHLHALPSYLSKESPLKSLYLRNNYLDKLKFGHLADYCLLERLEVAESHLGTDDLFRQCCDLVVWLDQHNVSHSLHCTRDSKPAQCEMVVYHEPDGRALVAYDLCLRRNGLLKPSMLWILGLIFFGFMVVAAVALAGYKANKHYKSKKAAAGEIENQSDNKKNEKLIP